MNWDQVRGNRRHVNGKIKTKWEKLTDMELLVIAGRKDELAAKLREKYGYAQEQADRELDEFAKTLNPA